MANGKLDGLGECHSSFFQLLQRACRLMELCGRKLKGDHARLFFKVDHRAGSGLLSVCLTKNPFSGFLKFGEVFENDRATCESLPQTNPPIFLPASADRLAYSDAWR